jgi:hypothetical protein
LKRGAKNRVKIDSKMLEEVSKLSGLGLTQQQIFNYYGIQKDTWYACLKKYPELKKAVLKGKSQILTLIASKLVKKALEGDMRAIVLYLDKFWEKEREDYMGNVQEVVKIKLNTSDPIEAAKVYQQIMKGN